MARKYAVLIEVDKSLERITGIRDNPSNVAVIFTDTEEENLTFYVHLPNVPDQETANQIVDALNAQVEARERSNSL